MADISITFPKLKERGIKIVHQQYFGDGEKFVFKPHVIEHGHTPDSTLCKLEVIEPTKLGGTILYTINQLDALMGLRR